MRTPPIRICSPNAPKTLVANAFNIHRQTVQRNTAKHTHTHDYAMFAAPLMNTIRPTVDPIAGFDIIKPMVFAGVFPSMDGDINDLKYALHC